MWVVQRGLYTIDATNDDRNWFPILPLRTGEAVEGSSRLGALLSAIPGWTDDALEAFLDSAIAIKTGKGRIAIGDWSFSQGDGEAQARQIRDRTPSLEGGLADLIQLQSGEIRFPRLAGELRRRFDPPSESEPQPPISDEEYSRLMIEGQNQLDGGDPETAMTCFVQCGVGDRETEHHRISLCLEAMGRQAEALAFLLQTRQKILDRGYYEAVAKLHGPPDIDDAEYFKTSFSDSFRAKVAERLKRLKPYLEQAELVDVNAVLATWRGRSHRSERNPGFPAGWEKLVPDTLDFEPTGSSSYMRAAYPLAESGEFTKAERVLAHEVASYGAIASSAPALHLMAILAAEQHALDRALDHMVFALDVDPDRNDTREMLRRFLEGEDIRLSIRT